uniref:Reverse transcriptase domain-containing protein n=1 Tax=Sparus aurata TaxID=8175 RepID=A0A671WE94_SPAAU
MEKNKSNIKNTWSVLNKLIKKGNQNADIPTEFLTNDRTLINQPNEIVNQFNQYFTNIGPKLAKEIVNTNQVDALSKIPTTDKTIFIQATDENEIISVVKNCKTKTSADWNGLDMSVLKDIIECVVKPISYIFNLSLQSGVFPEKMKMAKVMPIHKAGDKHEFTHYRPISILSQFSKILEKIFHKRLFSYVDKQSILCEQQYGFRPNRTTTLALVDLVEKISNAIDNKQYAVGVFLDLTKAFDTVNHELLLQKLYRYGMRGVAFSWLQTYLKNRSQYVHINGTDSQLLTVTCGLPQGAVLGPFLFLMYINDLCLVSKTLNLILFADDTNMLSCGKNLETLIDIVEKQLFLLKKWFDSNKLTLNLNKTKCIVFGNRAIDVHRNVIINDTEIERVNEITFLGVLLQNKLSWKPHINHIKAKLCKSLAIISKVKELLHEKMYIFYTVPWSFLT